MAPGAGAPGGADASAQAAMGYPQGGGAADYYAAHQQAAAAGMPPAPRPGAGGWGQ